MKVFLDANVILDYLTDRQPFADDAEAVVDFCVAEGNVGKITTLTACNSVYILAKVIGKQQAEEKIKELIDLIGLVGVEPESVSENIATNHIDFEDSVQLAEAVRWGAEVIVTRDKNGFTGSPIPVFTPTDFVAKYV